MFEYFPKIEIYCYRDWNEDRTSSVVGGGYVQISFWEWRLTLASGDRGSGIFLEREGRHVLLLQAGQE